MERKIWNERTSNLITNGLITLHGNVTGVVI